MIARRTQTAHLLPVHKFFTKLPYWLLVMLLLGVLGLWIFTSNQDYTVILRAVSRGILRTIYVSIVAYIFATMIGLVLGMMRASKQRIFREIATFYIEIVRGIPMLVILYYIAFVGAPALVHAINWVISPLVSRGIINEFSIRSLDFTWRAILALMIGYSAFIAEIFRAGIESVHRGQMESALVLGMHRRQAMRYVILPQASRNVLPPLGNEFIAMIKDSALVSVLGVQDITQLGKVYSASTFRFFETYNVVAFLYLVLTISLSIGMRALEQRMQRHKRVLNRM